MTIRAIHLMDPEGFHGLLRDAQAGDPKALAKLLEVIRPYLAAVARECTDASRASRSVSDLVQEAEMRVWQGLDQFQGGEHDAETLAKFRTWMARTVRRLALDLHRSRNTQKRKAPGYVVIPLDSRLPGTGMKEDPSRARVIDPPSGESTASAKLVTRERELLVQQAIDALPEDTDREIVQLFFFDQLSLREISTRLSLPYHDVRQRYRASLGRLERQLADFWR